MAEEKELTPAQVKKLQGDNEKLTEANAKLAEENKQLKKSNTDLTRLHKQAETELATTVKINEELTRQIEAGPTASGVEDKSEGISTKSFKVGEDTYTFRKKHVLYEGNKIGAAEVLASTDLQKELVKIQSGLIVKK
jgi:hypothetical protein